MDDLEILYNAMAKLAAKGKPFSDEQKLTVKETEDEFVVNKVIPTIEQALTGVIDILQCPIDITIHYVPGEDTKVKYQRSEEETESENDDFAEEENTVSEEKKERKTKRKTVGFSVSFADGTFIHRMKAVDTWIDALKKIGLELICDNGDRHEAWHRVEERDVCIVERNGVVRKDGHRPQNIVDGFYVMTQLSNEQKVKDLERLNNFQPQLGIKVKWDDEEYSEEEELEDAVEYGEKPDSYLVKSRVANGFALEVVKQLYNLDKLESVKPYFVRNQLTAVEKEGVFKLIGMFVRCTQEELVYRNTRSTSPRWYETPFEVDDDTLYLSNQWVDKPFGALRISDLQKMVATCYHGLLEVEILANGIYLLKEK
jgi:hypothetical protein